MKSSDKQQPRRKEIGSASPDFKRVSTPILEGATWLTESSPFAPLKSTSLNVVRPTMDVLRSAPPNSPPVRLANIKFALERFAPAKYALYIAALSNRDS